MTTILPEKNKKEIKNKYVVGFVSRVFISLITVSIIWIVLEVTAYYVVDFEKNVLEGEVATQDQQEKNSLINEYRQEIKTAKDLAGLFDLNESSKVEVIDFVFDIKTDEISITSVSTEKGEEATFVGISGIAEDRESLSEFNDLLNDSGIASEVDLPVSSFTKTFDIPFSITFVYSYE